MRRHHRIPSVLVVTVAFLIVLPAGAVPVGAQAAGAPVPAARAWILVDADSGRVLTRGAHHQPFYPASTTKLMTALVAWELLPPDATFVTGPTAAAQPAMRIGMKTGQTWTRSHALHSLLMVSANDAAYALAEAASGSLAAFADDMNATAGRYGMRDSVFNDPAGFDDSASFNGGSRVSAYDLAIAGRNLLAVPELAAIAALPEYDFQGPARPHQLTNHNKLLKRYPGAIGLKTGYTRQAGHTFVGAARRDGRTMIAVVLDAEDIYGSTASLLDHGFATPRGAAGTGERLPAPAVRPYEPPPAATLVQRAEEPLEESAGGASWWSRMMLLFVASGAGVVTLRRRAEMRRRARAERRRRLAEARRREFARLYDAEVRVAEYAGYELDRAGYEVL